MPSPNRVQTNPRYKGFCQDFFTAGDEEQFETIRDKTNPEEEKKIFFLGDDENNNIVEKNLFEGFQDLSAEAVIHTFRYIFHKFKKGLFIRIKDNKLTTFLPFSKAKFKNEWGHLIKVHPSTDLKTFLKHVCETEGYRFDENRINLNTDDWYANNCLLRYEFPVFEGDTGIHHMKAMLEELSVSRQLPDIELFINRRDFPLLKRNLTEPYDHIFSSQDIPLLSHKYDKYIPILSSVGREGYADIPIPTLEDWSRVKALENVEYPKSPMAHFIHDFSTPFDERIAKAVFRGSSTGAGVTIETNPRLLVAYISAVEQPKDDDGSLLLDAGITDWNLRPRKNYFSEYIQTIDVSSLPFGKVNKLSPTEQSKFKYIINIDGHSSAFRLSMEMNMGCVILLVDSDSYLWFRKLLQPYVHYVPVKKDLSDLTQKIKWCKRHDDECKEIIKACKKFYENFLSKEGILDYLQKLFIQLSQHFHYSYFPSPLELQLKSEKQFFDSSIPFHLSPKYPIKTLTTTKLSLIQLCGNLVLKKTSDPKKGLENLHEAFIALKELNAINSNHFVKVFGYLPKDHTVILQQCQGITFFKWLQSSDFHIGTFMTILGQIALALQTAQNRCCFVHQDLFPWNVMLKASETTDLEYVINYQTVIRFSAKIIPVILDFGKAHVVSEGIHYGFVNMFQPDSIQDIFCIVISSLSVILKRPGKPPLKEMMFLANFFTRTLFHPEKISTYESLFKFVEKYSAFVNLISLDKKDLSHKRPIDFFNYLFPQVPAQNFLKVPLKKVFQKRLPIIPQIKDKIFVYYFFQKLSTPNLEKLFETQLASSSWPEPQDFDLKDFAKITLDLSEELFQNVEKCTFILSKQKKLDKLIFDYAFALCSILVYKGVYEMSLLDRRYCIENYSCLLSVPLFSLQSALAGTHTLEKYCT